MPQGVATQEESDIEGNASVSNAGSFLASPSLRMRVNPGNDAALAEKWPL